MRRILNYRLALLNRLNRQVRKLAISGIESQYGQIVEEAERFRRLVELYRNLVTDLIEGLSFPRLSRFSIENVGD
jgi:hypothetical protein